jgi:hypothetical protein
MIHHVYFLARHNNNTSDHFNVEATIDELILHNQKVSSYIKACLFEVKIFASLFLYGANLINIQRLDLRLKKASTGKHRGLRLTIIF